MTESSTSSETGRPVTAMQRQREREEKRRRKMERAKEKRKQKKQKGATCSFYLFINKWQPINETSCLMIQVRFGTVIPMYW